jgi:hypothetical protein
MEGKKMALNFLKRKKNLQSNILLINLNHKQTFRRSGSSIVYNRENQPEVNLICPDSSIQSKNTSGATLQNILQKIRHPKESSHIELPSNNSNSQHIEDIEEFSDIENNIERNWEKAKNHINNLIFEISKSALSDDKKQQKPFVTTESPLENSSKPEPLKLSSNQEIKSAKYSQSEPLDIHELQNVAEMAKRLKSNSKTGN